MSMSYREAKGRHIIQKDGMYFSLTQAQVGELMEMLREIQDKERKHHISGAGPALHTQKEIAALWDKHTQRRTQE